MLRKIHTVCSELFFPQSHVQRFLASVSFVKFLSLCSPQPQLKKRMFHPFYYKNNFVKDCIIELKERNSKYVAQYFGKVLAQWIMREVTLLDSRLASQVGQNEICTNFYLVPIPQHKNKTREKGFCHTTTLTQYIYSNIKRYNVKNIFIKPCIIKHTQTKKVHTTKSKKARLYTLKNTTSAYVTKQDARHGYFFLIDDVYTTGSTFKEARRSLLDSGALEENIYFVSIAH